ncbi:hypothetical protein [Methylomonas albis]|nr:hypothetical protein [Methylomonas albis]
MITSRFLALFLGFAVLQLQGCSSEESQSKISRKDAVSKQIVNSPKDPLNSDTDTLPSSGTVHPDAEPPSRSELRVMSEETKATEEQAKRVIERFDENLNNREQRKVAETEFKNMLPEYKAKMLQLGKAQLQHEK